MTNQDKKPFKLEKADDGRLFSPSTARNQDFIREVFLGIVPANARVLEIASGSGQHFVHMLKKAPEMSWIASDVIEEARASCHAWSKFENLESQIEEIMIIDASTKEWGINGKVDAIFSCNMLHIAPWNVGLGLFAGASKYLKPNGHLFVYGPFKRNGEHIAQSNVDFDESLRGRDPLWGIRDLEADVIPAAQRVGLMLHSIHPMPANNFSVVFERTSES